MTAKKLILTTALALVFAGCETTSGDPEYKDTPPSMNKASEPMAMEAEVPEAMAEDDEEDDEEEETPVELVTVPATMETIEDTVPINDTPPSMNPLLEQRPPQAPPEG